MRDCLNNYIEWRLDRQEEEEERGREVVEMVVGNPLLRDQIFRHLEPSDLKAVALVCRAWNSAVESAALLDLGPAQPPPRQLPGNISGGRKIFGK